MRSSFFVTAAVGLTLILACLGLSEVPAAADSWGGRRVTAYGGMRLVRRAAVGSATLLLPFPTHGGHQTVDARSLTFQLLDVSGNPLHHAVQEVERVDRRLNPLKQMLRVRLDLAAMPEVSQLGWSVATHARDVQVDLSASIPLPSRRALPADTHGWLKHAPMIQTDAPAMAVTAQQIRARAHDLQSLVKETLLEIGRRRMPFEQMLTISDFQNDALSFLETGVGECTAHANLFAALMRKNGVPTRVVTVIQRGGNVQNMHYQNEYYAPGRGWVHVEPGQSQTIQTSRTDGVHTGVVDPRMEQVGHGFLRYAGVHQFSMIGQLVDASDEPLPAPHPLEVTVGLRTPRDPSLAIHGAE